MCDAMVYVLPIPLGFNSYNISHLEVLNMEVICKNWANYWKNKDLQFGNLAVCVLACVFFSFLRLSNLLPHTIHSFDII